MKKKTLLFGLLWLIIAPISFAQKISNVALTADSLATGNYKDVLSSFFQLAFNKVIGPNKEISFTSNPFAVMAKMDTSLLTDTKYYKYRHLRDLNFAFSAKLDSSYNFNGFSSSIKYAIINDRDETVSRAFLISVADNYKSGELFTLNNRLNAYIATFVNTPDIQKKLRDQTTQFYRGEINFDKLDVTLQNKIKEFTVVDSLIHLSSLLKEDPKYNLKKNAKQIYEDLKNTFNQKLLWTLSLSDTTYKYQFFFSNILLKTELLKGFGKYKAGSNWEFNINGAINFTDDTLAKGRDLKRSILNFEPGINWVIRNKNNDKSFLELKFSGSYNRKLATLYAKEKRDSITINSTIRVRIISDIWVPLEIKYDPKSGNVFGFLNVRANFTALGRFAKGLMDQ